ncbi:hypothetical protein [Halorhodospira halochloris]|nr:hypothetical protein [Halorhodospira halochloris]
MRTNTEHGRAQKSQRGALSVVGALADNRAAEQAVLELGYLAARA